MSKRILHIAPCDKFIPPFIGFIKNNFSFEQHEFLLLSGMGEANLAKAKNIYLAKRAVKDRFKYYFRTTIKMQQADKIILHGLFDIKLVLILFFTPWLLKKCYWVVWGGDLYVYQFGERNWKWKIKEFFRRPVIKNMGNLVTYIEGDIELARKWYGAKGQYRECIMYLSNVYKELGIPESISEITNIQVGNSADPSNNHIEALEKLLPYKDDDICIYVPLSYGDQIHAKKVITQGKKWFGDKFIPLTDFMPFEEYLRFLGSIDIAIFNHKRQQAMGNAITLLGLGKKVYMRSDVTQWDFFQELGIKVSDITQIESSLYESCKQPALSNLLKVKSYFSRENLLNQLKAFMP